MNDFSNIVFGILSVAAFYYFMIRPILKKNKEDAIKEAYLGGIARMIIHSDRKKGKVLPPEEGWKYRRIAERFNEEVLKTEFRDGRK